MIEENEKYVCFLCGEEHKSDDYCPITHTISGKHKYYTQLIGGVKRTTVREPIEVKTCETCFWKRFFLRFLLSYFTVIVLAIFCNGWENNIQGQIEFAYDNFGLILFVGTILSLVVNVYVVGPYFGKFIPILRKTNEYEAYVNNAVIQNDNKAETSKQVRFYRYIGYFLLGALNLLILYFSVFIRAEGFDFWSFILGVPIINITLIFIWFIIKAILISIGVMK